jgi:hypothetical protein
MWKTHFTCISDISKDSLKYFFEFSRFFSCWQKEQSKKSVPLGEKGVTEAETTSRSKFMSAQANCITSRARIKKCKQVDKRGFISLQLHFRLLRAAGLSAALPPRGDLL